MNNFCCVLSMFLLTVMPIFGQGQTAGRLPGSPYPVSVTPTELYVINDWGWGELKRLPTITLQGLVAKKSNIMIYNESGVGYSIWLNDIEENYGVVRNMSFYDDFEGLMTHFKDYFDGYILCNINDNSSNVAVSLCNKFNAIAVTTDSEALMAQLGKSMILDVRGKDENWLLENYNDVFSRDVVCLQDETKCVFLSDYAVFSGALQFYDPDINSSLVSNAFGRMNSNKAVLGWGPDEKNTVEKLSTYSLHLNAADWTENIPVLSNFEVPLKQKTHVDNVDDRDDVHTVCFLVSDGDSYDWMLKEFYGDGETAYGSPNRGQHSIGWTISTSMCELAPTVMNLFYEIATNTSDVQDYFVASSSGIGYMKPDLFPDLASSAELTNAFMGKADLNILNIIGKEYHEKDMELFLKHENIDAIFYYLFENYAGLNGKIFLVNDKPVIGARYRLWDGFGDAHSVAAKINDNVKDASTSDGYSLVAVHAWSFNKYIVDEINTCVSLLDDDVIVVSPDEFVKKIKNKISNFDNAFNVYPNPVKSGSELKITGFYKKGDVIELADIGGATMDVKTLNEDYTGTVSFLINNSIPTGVYFINIKRPGKKFSYKVIIQN